MSCLKWLAVAVLLWGASTSATAQDPILGPPPAAKPKVMRLSPGRASTKPKITTPADATSNQSTPGDSMPGEPPAEQRDPTDPQGELRRLLNQQERSTSRPTGPVFPVIEVRARIIGTKQKPTALLALNEKRLLTVQAGRTYALPDQPDVSLSVVEISIDGVLVEWLPEGQQLLLP